MAALAASSRGAGPVLRGGAQDNSSTTPSEAAVSPSARDDGRNPHLAGTRLRMLYRPERFVESFECHINIPVRVRR
jgi:hypothetical protein